MTAPQSDFAGALDRMPGMFDEPFGDSAAWSNYLVAQFARREVTVALSGEGGDEIFCGYPRYWSRVGGRSNFLNRSLARYLPPLSRLASSMQRRGYEGLPAYAAALGGMTAQQIDSLLAPAWTGAGTTIIYGSTANIGATICGRWRSCDGSISIRTWRKAC